jgi:hypothetical protein
MSSLAVPALKLGVHVLKTLWKVWPCSKCEAPTPVGHVQQQISSRKANSSKNYMCQRFFLFLHLHAVLPVSVSKYQAYPQKYQIVHHSTYF